MRVYLITMRAQYTKYVHGSKVHLKRAGVLDAGVIIHFSTAAKLAGSEESIAELVKEGGKPIGVVTLGKSEAVAHIFEDLHGDKQSELVIQAFIKNAQRATAGR